MFAIESPADRWRTMTPPIAQAIVISHHQLAAVVKSDTCFWHELPCDPLEESIPLTGRAVHVRKDKVGTACFAGPPNRPMAFEV